MNAAFEARALALLEACLALPEEARAEFLERECAGQTELHARLVALLRADRDSAGFLEPAPLDVLPERVGPYRLLRELGRGGMGQVYLGERADALYQKQVAIKFLRFDHGDLRARFATERRILAALDHPSIARLIDAGKDARGQPYVVMDYIEGTTLTQYAGGARLSVAERITLFLAVLDAVGHAHAHLVVHRDLKPANILVDAEGRPRLLDFGIAKLLGPDDPGGITTGTGGFAFTPDYASPEQIRGEPVGIGSDIYSLGVLLFELLTGTRPYRLEGCTPATIERVVCEGSVPRPSEVLRTRRAPAIARDLDHIVLKALAKSRAARYRSCQEFADDLRRFLEGRPVQARATPRYEVVLKFVRRHRAAVLASVLGVGALLAVTAWALLEAREATEQARRAALERDRAERIRLFLTDMLAAADPATGGRDLRVVDLLDAAARELDSDRVQDPVSTGAIRSTLAQSYRALGRLDAALTQAKAAYDGAPAAPPEARAQAALLLGQIQLERGDAAAALALLESAATAYEGIPGRILEQAAADNLLGQLHSQAGRFDRAEAYYQRAILRVRGADAPASAQLAELINNLGVARGRAGRLDEAEELHRAALAMFRATRGAEHPHTVRCWFNLASVLEMRGRFDAADAALGQIAAIQRRHYGDHHPELAQSLAGHAFLLNRVGRHAEALTRARAAVAAAAELTRPHPIAAYAEAMLGESLLATGAAAEARVHLLDALEQREQLLPPDHPVRLSSLGLLGASEAASGDCSVGLARMRQAADRLEATLGAEHEFTRRARARLERHAAPHAGTDPGTPTNQPGPCIEPSAGDLRAATGKHAP